MSTTIYLTAKSGTTDHRFRRATCKVRIHGSAPLEVQGYRLATGPSSWLIHRPVRNGALSERGWTLTHSGIGLGLGYIFDTLDAAKSLVLSLAESTGTNSTPVLDATPFGRASLSPKGLAELRRVRDVVEEWREAAAAR